MANSGGSAEDYIHNFNLHVILKEAIRELCYTRPERPYAFLSNYFEKLASEEHHNSRVPPQYEANIVHSSLSHSKSHQVHEPDEYKNEPEPEVTVTRESRPSITRRGAISAEVISPADVKNFTRTHQVIPKDYKTMQALERAFENNVLLRSCDEEQRGHIFDAMSEQTFTKGTVIIKQGDSGNFFYVIDQGEVEVLVNDKQVALISEWGTFGELALIHGRPRQATVVAKTDVVKLWAIDRETYRKILMSLQQQKREKYDDFLSKVRILDNLQDWERLTVADALEAVSFEAGMAIVREGDLGNEFFIVIDGTADVTQNSAGNIKKVGQLGPSDYFGELALILDRPRAATVTAKTYIRCVKLDRSRFERVMGPAMDILKRTEYYKEYIKYSV